MKLSERARNDREFVSQTSQHGHQRRELRVPTHDDQGLQHARLQSRHGRVPERPNLTTSENVAKICGPKRTSLESVAKGNNMYVSDFSNFGQWSDPSKAGVKFVARGVGFFCCNEDRQKLPSLAILVVDTNLIYTLFDRTEEWTLAKMALDTAEVTFQQMQYLADSHAVLNPVTIEARRNLAAMHPVNALLLCVSSADFGIEQLPADLLFNTSTALDYTFGFGAVGCIQFLASEMQSASAGNDFEADIKNRGLKHLPMYKYATYGQLYDALKKTVTSYLEAYYPSDKAVAEDAELQNWAKSCAVVSQLRCFPKRFISVSALQKVLTHLIFQTTIHHHAMNGAVSWQSASVPYSTPALWKKLPAQKLAANETLNVLECSTPKQLLPVIITLSFKFDRYVPASELLFALFNVAPFTDEPKIANVISDFEKSLRAIDTLMVAAEQSEKYPYIYLCPSMLALNRWV